MSVGVLVWASYESWVFRPAVSIIIIVKLETVFQWRALTSTCKYCFIFFFLPADFKHIALPWRLRTAADTSIADCSAIPLQHRWCVCSPTLLTHLHSPFTQSGALTWDVNTKVCVLTRFLSPFALTHAQITVTHTTQSAVWYTKVSATSCAHASKDQSRFASC